MQPKQRIDLYRAYPRWHRAGCVFIHVPKAAGTSVNRALFGRTLGHYRATDVQRHFPGLYRKSFVFAFVRNPWDRALSAYRFAKVGRTESMGVHRPAQYRVPEFETFERFLHEWLAKRDLTKADFMFQPQHLFVCGAAEKPMLDFVGKVENIAEDMKIVSDRLGRTVNLHHSNKTSDKGGYAEHYHGKAMVDLVARIYARDIATFHYDFE